jgi:23S rRNA pseudouridine2605 synthase
MAPMEEQDLRLQKYLSSLGVASRREAEGWITQGRVELNGRVVKKLGTRVNPLKDRIKVDGKSVAIKTPSQMYWMCHKPDFVLTTRSEEEKKPTIYDLPKLRKYSSVLKPVGRLDYRTEGLLLMTNDGDLAHRLMHPRYQIQREYRVWVKTVLNDEMLKKIRKGFWIGDGVVKNVEIHFQRRGRGGPGAWYQIRLMEGRNRVIRKMFQALRVEIRRLVRVGYGGVSMPSTLKPGDCKPLTEQQIKHLRTQCGLPV